MRRAAELLGVPRRSLKIKVLSEEKRGLFGMDGAKPAKIRASAMTQEHPKKKS